MGSDFRRFIRQLRGALKGLQAGIKALGNPRKAIHEMIQDFQKLTVESENSEKRVLYLTVGMALSAWADMEETIVAIGTLLLRTTAPRAGLVFYHIINFSVWLMIIDELFAMDEKFAFLKPKWNKASERLRRIKDQRDSLAHHALKVEGYTELKLGKTRLKPAQFDTRQKSKKLRPLGIDEVLEFTEQTVDIAKKLMELAMTMLEIYESSPQKSSG